jgi:hypothetical protein
VYPDYLGRNIHNPGMPGVFCLRLASVLPQYFRVHEEDMGFEYVQTVRAEGMNIPPLATSAVPNGEKAVEALVI